MVVGSPIVLNLIPGGVMPVMMINETDKGYKKEFLIYNGAAPYNLPANVSATIRGTKRDGYGVTEAAEVTAGSNLVRITVTEQMTAVPGPNIFELVFEDTNNLKVATINFIMMVERSALNSNTVISDSDIAYAVQVLDKLQSVAAFKEQLDNADADIAELQDVKVQRYDTVAQMKADTALKVGIYARTGGYYSVGDDGGALYRIYSTAPATHYEVLANGLYAKLVTCGLVFPEQFGAHGDGVTDDSAAIQRAINSGKTVCLGNKTYVTGSAITLGNNKIINFGRVIYSGTDYAFILAPTANVDGGHFVLGVVIAGNGGCLKIDSTYAWLQYVTIDFIRFSANASKNCVYANVAGTNWINEIRFLNGRFAQGSNGVYIDDSEKTDNSAISHWTFDKVGFEGITNGLNVPANVTRISLTNCRAEESISNVLYSRAASYSLMQTATWFGVIANGNYWKNAQNYMILFESGFISERGTRVTKRPVCYKNGMLYGLQWHDGANNTDSSFGAYTYDSGTNTQETDFKAVYDYTTENSQYYRRPYIRRFAISNTAGAVETNIYLDDRMFNSDYNDSDNSFLLTATMSPNSTLHIYDKRGGTLLYTKSNGATTAYPRFIVYRTHNLFYIEEGTVTFKSV